MTTENANLDGGNVGNLNGKTGEMSPFSLDWWKQMTRKAMKYAYAKTCHSISSAIYAQFNKIRDPSVPAPSVQKALESQESIIAKAEAKQKAIQDKIAKQTAAKVKAAAKKSAAKAKSVAKSSGYPKASPVKAKAGPPTKSEEDRVMELEAIVKSQQEKMDRILAAIPVHETASTVQSYACDRCGAELTKNGWDEWVCELCEFEEVNKEDEVMD